MRNISATAAALLIISGGPAIAQNSGTNAGVWWRANPGQPAPFALLDPATTVYGRIGAHWNVLRPGTVESDNNPGVFFGFVPETSNVFGGTIGFGFRLMPVLRFDLTASGTAPSASRSVDGTLTFTSRLWSTQLMANAYFDLAPLFGPGGLGGFNPYVTAGVGVAINRWSDYFVTRLAPPVNVVSLAADRQIAALAWQLGVGLQYQILNNLIVDVSYQYVAAGEFGHAGSVTLTPAGALTVFASRGPLAIHRFGVALVVPIDGLVRALGN